MNTITDGQHEEIVALLEAIIKEKQYHIDILEGIVANYEELVIYRVLQTEKTEPTKVPISTFQYDNQPYTATTEPTPEKRKIKQILTLEEEKSLYGLFKQEWLNGYQQTAIVGWVNNLIQARTEKEGTICTPVDKDSLIEQLEEIESHLNRLLRIQEVPRADWDNVKVFVMPLLRTIINQLKS